jgi:hypothetical protein
MYIVHQRKYCEHEKLDHKILTDLHLFSTLITKVVFGMTSVCARMRGQASRWLDVGLGSGGKICFMFSI